MYRQILISVAAIALVFGSVIAPANTGSDRDRLHQFRGGPSAQVAQGYDFELAAYRVHSEDGDGLHGHFWVHIRLNRDWWEAYYALSRSLASPLLQDTVRDGPLTILGTGRRTDIGVASGEQIPLHPDLADAMARRVPVTLQVGDHQAEIALHRNLLIADFAPDQVALNVHSSELECGHSRHAACGHQFVIGIPFSAAHEEQIHRAMEEGLALWYTPLTE